MGDSVNLAVYEKFLKYTLCQSIHGVDHQKNTMFSCYCSKDHIFIEKSDSSMKS